MKHSADVLVVGGGIIGLSCAWRLREAGLSVQVLEKGVCGQEASWAGAGILSPCSWHRTDELARIHMDSIFSYHEFVAALESISDIDTEYRRCGELKPILDDNRMKMALKEVRTVADRQTPEGQPIAELLSVDEVRTLEPQLAKPMLAAEHIRLTARIRNNRLVAALKQACERLGVLIREHCAVQGLLTDGERVTQVRTAVGDFSADQFLMCAGAWSSQLDQRLQRVMPVHPVRGQIVLLHCEHLPIDRIIYQDEAHFYMVPRDDGHLLIGSTEEHDAGFDKRNTAAAVQRLCALALEYVPALSQAAVVGSWAGLRPGTPDRRPFMGSVPGLENLIAATGHFRTGLTCAPVIAQLITDLVRTGSCALTLKKAAPGRVYPQGARQAPS